MHKKKYALDQISRLQDENRRLLEDLKFLERFHKETKRKHKKQVNLLMQKIEELRGYRIPRKESSSSDDDTNSQSNSQNQSQRSILHHLNHSGAQKKEEVVVNNDDEPDDEENFENESPRQVNNDGLENQELSDNSLLKNVSP